MEDEGDVEKKSCSWGCVWYRIIASGYSETTATCLEEIGGTSHEDVTHEYANFFEDFLHLKDAGKYIVKSTS